MFRRTLKTKRVVELFYRSKNFKTFNIKKANKFKYNKTIYELNKIPISQNSNVLTAIIGLGIFYYEKIELDVILKSKTLKEFTRNIKRAKPLTTSFLVVLCISGLFAISEFKQRGTIIKKINLLMPSLKRSQNNIRNSFVRIHYGNTKILKIPLYKLQMNQVTPIPNYWKYKKNNKKYKLYLYENSNKFENSELEDVVKTVRMRKAGFN
ncbi:hypothetical protein MHBO_002324 [Bonamia ostreae]|uniref:Uncharacterized protein n=1 Tax=Bonamia ostreae TaxID=126728 RepID=A0ABV2AMY2_9EUKA